MVTLGTWSESTQSSGGQEVSMSVNEYNLVDLRT